MNEQLCNQIVQPVEANVLASGDTAIADFVRQIAQFAVQPTWQGVERRAQKRYPYPKLIALTPLQDDRLVPCSETVQVVGKNLSLCGIDFFHTQPIPQRSVLISLERGVDRYVHLVLKVSWCRFLKPGWYDSGGKFTQVVDWPTGNYETTLQ